MHIKPYKSTSKSSFLCVIFFYSMPHVSLTISKRHSTSSTVSGSERHKTTRRNGQRWNAIGSTTRLSTRLHPLAAATSSEKVFSFTLVSHYWILYTLFSHNIRLLIEKKDSFKSFSMCQDRNYLLCLIYIAPSLHFSRFNVVEEVVTWVVTNSPRFPRWMLQL